MRDLPQLGDLGRFLVRTRAARWRGCFHSRRGAHGLGAWGAEGWRSAQVRRETERGARAGVRTGSPAAAIGCW